MAGCEFCGIHLTLDQFKKVWSILDYDENDEIDFNEFCLINTDKTNDIHRLIGELRQQRIEK